MDDEDDLVLWQDILDEVAAGRTQQLVCPFCRDAGQKGEVVVKQIAHKTRLECRNCRRYIEGKMGD